MVERDLIKSIKNLRQIKPDPDWALFCRSELLKELHGTKKENAFKPEISTLVSPLNLINVLNFANQFVFAAFRLSPAKAAVTLTLMFLMAGGIVFNESQDSLPGSAFYPLKLTSEDLVLRFAPGDENKLSLHAEFAERRVKEISALSRNAEIDAELLFPLLDGYKNELASVKEILDSAVTDGNGKASKLAEKVTKDAEKYQASLSVVSKNFSSASQKDLNEAIAYTEDTNIKALTVLNASTDESEEWARKLREIIEGKISSLNASLEGVEDESVAGQVRSLIDKAKELLEKGDPGALEEALTALSGAEGSLVLYFSGAL